MTKCFLPLVTAIGDEYDKTTGKYIYTLGLGPIPCTFSKISESQETHGLH